MVFYVVLMEILEYLLSYFHNKTVDDINSKIFPSSIALLHRKFIELQWTRALHAFPPTSYLYVSCVSHPSKFTKCNITWITHSLASKSSLRYTISLIFFVKEGEIYDFINSLFNRLSSQMPSASVFFMFLLKYYCTCRYSPRNVPG